MSSSSLHIAVNARFLLPGRLEGLGRFSHEVLQRLVRQHPEARFTFLFDRPWDKAYVYGPNVRPLALFPPARHPLLYLVWFEGRLAWTLRRLRPDVYFAPDGYLVLGADLPQVPVFHDLAYVHYPEDMDRWHRWHYRTFFPRYARHAAHLLTVSEATRQDIIQSWKLPGEKITVVHNGSSGKFRPQSEAAQAEVRAQFTEGAPYFLYVGAMHPRKNLARLFAAFDRYRTQTGADTRLVMVGRRAWSFEEIQRSYQQMQHREAVIFTGYVDDETLARLYGGALGLCYVSMFEGFGLPLLEAMYAETALITSNRSSMPEVAGPAALLVDPENVEAIAGAMARLTLEPGLRAALIEAGRRQRTRFSWDETAERCGAVLTRVARTFTKP